MTEGAGCSRGRNPFGSPHANGIPLTCKEIRPSVLRAVHRKRRAGLQGAGGDSITPYMSVSSPSVSLNLTLMLEILLLRRDPGVLAKLLPSGEASQDVGASSELNL